MNKLFLILLGSILFVGCQKQSADEHTESEKTEHKHEEVKSYYTCAMHPEVRESAPGKCPICHMNLTKVEEATQNTEQKHDVNERSIDAGVVIKKLKLKKSQLKHFRPTYFPATYMKMSKKIRLLGSVLQSEDKESSIPARISGRVEKVYIKSTGSFIKEGDPVLDLYAPKLITAGEEYLIARKSLSKTKKNSKEFKEMLTQTEERLKLWGIKASQYEAWFKNGEVPKNITLYSPATGIVRKRNAIVGKYFTEGQNFFELSDLSEIWVEMDVYEQDSALIVIGQKVQIEFTSLPGEVTESEIDFVNPVLNSASRTLKVRTTVKNKTGRLKPGMVADVTLTINMSEKSLVVPRTAIIDTGKRKIVWSKKSESIYQAKNVKTGRESEGHVEVVAGLEEGEEVVADGNFLLDAQAQLFGGLEEMPEVEKSEHSH